MKLSQRTQTILIVGVVLGGVLIFGLVTGQFQDTVDDMFIIVRHLFS